MEGDKIGGDISIPLEFLTGFYKGNYLNGSAEFTVTLANGRLMVFLESAVVNEKPLPEDFMKGFRGTNLAEELHNDPDVGPILEKIKSIEINDGRLIITPKTSE